MTHARRYFGGLRIRQTYRLRMILAGIGVEVLGEFAASRDPPLGSAIGATKKDIGRQGSHFYCSTPLPAPNSRQKKIFYVPPTRPPKNQCSVKQRGPNKAIQRFTTLPPTPPPRPLYLIFAIDMSRGVPTSHSHHQVPSIRWHGRYYTGAGTCAMFGKATIGQGRLPTLFAWEEKSVVVVAAAVGVSEFVFPWFSPTYSTFLLRGTESSTEDDRCPSPSTNVRSGVIIVFIVRSSTPV